MTLSSASWPSRSSDKFRLPHFSSCQVTHLLLLSNLSPCFKLLFYCRKPTSALLPKCNGCKITTIPLRFTNTRAIFFQNFFNSVVCWPPLTLLALGTTHTLCAVIWSFGHLSKSKTDAVKIATINKNIFLFIVSKITTFRNRK